MLSENVKNYVVAVCYITLLIILIAVAIDYSKLDTEEILDEFSESMYNLAKTINCEIDYKDFHYKGFCPRPEIILEYAYNMTAR